MRLTALMTLGARSTHELKFTEVQQALGLGSDGEVEAWIVRAIGKVGQNHCKLHCIISKIIQAYLCWEFQVLG